MDIRLDKFLCEALGITRAEAKKLIAKQTVTVDSVRAKSGDVKLDGEKSRVALNGKTLTREKFVYIMLNKPAGVVSASEDKNDVTVVDLVRADFPRRRLFPRGRLDKTSTGFVLLTDDGVFAHDILSPKRHVEKEYEITTDAPVTDRVVRAFSDGVTLASGEKMQPAVIIPHGDGCSATVILKQGVYHQIKRMLGVFGIGVNSLHRRRIGGLTMPDTLAPGEYIKLDENRVSQIKRQN